MADKITISKVKYGNPASSAQTWTVKYKKSDSAGAYITATTTAVDDGGENLITPVVISGLVPGGLYYVQISNNCGSSEIYQQSVQLT